MLWTSLKRLIFINIMGFSLKHRILPSLFEIILSSNQFIDALYVTHLEFNQLVGFGYEAFFYLAKRRHFMIIMFNFPSIADPISIMLIYISRLERLVKIFRESLTRSNTNLCPLYQAILALIIWLICQLYPHLLKIKCPYTENDHAVNFILIILIIVFEVSLYCLAF